MSLENYEGTAIDTSLLEEVQTIVEPEVDVVETTDIVEDDTIEEVVLEEIIPEETNTITEYDIPGVGKLTAEQIKEMNQGVLRQSDYTKKTQELARQREELKNAEELFNHIKTNPHLLNALREAEYSPNTYVQSASPESEMIRKLAYSQKAMEVDMKLNDLKGRYGDVDEVELFKKANELNTDDLEFVYKGLKYEKEKKDNIEDIIKRAKEEAKAELKAELEANRGAVETAVSTTKASIVTKPTTLTADEKRVASAMGMTEEDYRKWL